MRLVLSVKQGCLLEVLVPRPSQSSGTCSCRDAIVNACVFIHQTLHQANHRLSKRGARTILISPRAFLDLINHYAKVMQEKKSDLEEQQVTA